MRCRNCTRLGLVCKPPDLFRASNLSWSKVKRACHVSTVSDDVGRPGLAILGLNDGALYFDCQGEKVTSMSPSSICAAFRFVPTLPQWAKPLPMPRASPMEDYFLQHYIERSSSVLINVDGPTNSLRSIILPRAVTSSMLSNALFAISSLHASICDDNPEYRMTSLVYYNNASTALYRLISDFGSNTSVEGRELSLLASVFLCKYEIISGGTTNWRSHLRGLQKMFSIFKRSTPQLSQDLVSYIQSL